MKQQWLKSYVFSDDTWWGEVGHCKYTTETIYNNSKNTILLKSEFRDYADKTESARFIYQTTWNLSL